MDNLGQAYRALDNVDRLKASALGQGGLELAPLLNVIDDVYTDALAAYDSAEEDKMQAVYSGVADLTRAGTPFTYPVDGPGLLESNPLGNIAGVLDWLNDLINYAPASTDASEEIAQAKQDQYQLMCDLYATLTARFGV